MLASLLPPFLDTYNLWRHLDVRPIASSSTSLSSSLLFFPNPFKERSRVCYKGDFPGVYSFDEVSAAANVTFKKFSRLSGEHFSFLYFLSFPLIWCSLQSIFQSTCNYLVLQVFRFFLEFVVLFLPLFVFLNFSLWPWSIFLR